VITRGATFRLLSSRAGKGPRRRSPGCAYSPPQSSPKPLLGRVVHNICKMHWELEVEGCQMVLSSFSRHPTRLDPRMVAEAVSSRVRWHLRHLLCTPRTQPGIEVLYRKCSTQDIGRAACAQPAAEAPRLPLRGSCGARWTSPSACQLVCLQGGGSPWLVTKYQPVRIKHCVMCRDHQGSGVTVYDCPCPSI
jgi:hypothetical protein